MFEAHNPGIPRSWRLAMIGLLGFSAAALVVTLSVMAEFLHEQEIVRGLVRLLPEEAAHSAEELAGELRWQFRLTTLVVLNLIATGIALVLLARAYRSSQQSLSNIKYLASDILNSMDQAVITTNCTGTVTSINGRGLELLGIERRVIGKPLAEACSVMDLDSFRREAVERNPTRIVRDYVVPYAVGNRTLAATGQPLRDAKGTEIGAVLQVRDVTERALMEQQVQRMERFSGLGSLAAGLHHEIKNPLAALSLHVQLLEEQLEHDTLSNDTREILDVLKTEVARITSVLESFRGYASVDRLEKTLVNINSVLQRQLKLIAPQATASHIDLISQLAPSLQSVRVDQNKIEQVILNLLINAVEAMPSGGRLMVSTLPRENSVVVRIHDTGCGVSENLRQRIFDPYFTTKGQGTGMGLAICEKIIRQHGGTLVLSPSDEGAAFEIIIPGEGI